MTPVRSLVVLDSWLFHESQLLLLVVPRDFFSTAQGRVANMGGACGGYANVDVDILRLSGHSQGQS
jgi:hypothetical protein